MIEKVKKENPKMSQQEINFHAQKQYEELLGSQVLFENRDSLTVTGTIYAKFTIYASICA